MFLKPTPKKISVLLLTTISNGVPTSFLRHPKPTKYWVYRSSDPCFGVSVKCSLYLSLVQSYLGYAIEVWTPLQIGGLCTIEGVQCRATKYILGYPDALIPYKESLIKLNLLPVSYWHEIRDLVFFFKAINGIPYLPVYKSTCNCLKIGPKNRPRLIHGSKSQIKKLSGQISITIV